MGSPFRPLLFLALFGGRLWRRLVEPAPRSMARLDSLQFRTLFVSEIRRHLPVHLGHRLVNALAGLDSDPLELSGGVIDNWRHLRDLFRREFELRPQPFPHALAQDAAMMFGKKEMRAEKCAGHAAGEKDEHEADQQLPFQRGAHCENSSWIAASAIANLLENESSSSLVWVISR